jgi:hypothetical protein
MKRLMRVHRYLSCFVAPAMLFFAVSGAWQAFRLQEQWKNSAYRPPVALQELSKVHKAEKLSGPAANWFRAALVVLSAAFVATAAIGVVMALRIGRPTWLVWLTLGAGALLPLLLAVAARSAGP